MEILKPVKEQVDKIKKLSTQLTLEPIVTHIERAEHFFKLGKDSNDENYFTDAVYRTNQAFEGCSRQAYMVLANKSEEEAQSIKAYKIEDYFITNQILNDRVIPQFKNYRDNWRNESAHNYKLFFNQSEAYFAILSVTSYAYLLFNQIIQYVSYQIESEQISKRKSELNKIKNIIESKSKSLTENLSEVIEEFSKGNDSLHHEEGIDELQIIAMLAAYIKSSSPLINVYSDKLLDNTNYRTDLLVELGDKKSVIEIKRFFRPQYLEASIEQLITYLRELNISEGIIYYSSYSDASPIYIKEIKEIKKEDKTFNIHIIKT